MSQSIVAVLSQLTQLRGSLRHTAQRLAYFADQTGRVQKSFREIAADLHIAPSTAKRHIPKLLDKGIITKTTVRLSRWRCAVNVYQFADWIMEVVRKRAASSRMRQSQQEREKPSSRARENPRPQEERWWFEAYAATHGLGYGAPRSP